MKKLFFIIFSIILVSCESITEEVEGTYPNNQAKKISYYKSVEGEKIKVEVKEFYLDGQLKMGGKFLDGKRTGEWKAYFEDGKLQSEGAFLKGKRTGKGKVFYPSGTLRYEGEYKDGIKTGHWKFYDSQGNLAEEKDY